MTNHVPWRVTRGEVKRVLDDITDSPEAPCEKEGDDLLMCYAENGPLSAICMKEKMILDKCVQSSRFKDATKLQKMARKKIIDDVMKLTRSAGMSKRLGVRRFN
eukprot:gb/GEZN01033505.1/.p1 GENE.gb/GEZN01033505.1/~~gb/GEZN01033505.1/.p1  ORF type:complete len:104 (-),score=11.82 gb/GEZN01033505.1/:50-361(-)